MAVTNASTPRPKTGNIPCSTMTRNPLKRNAEAYIELSNEGYLHIEVVDVLVSVIVSVSVYATSKIVAMLKQC